MKPTKAGHWLQRAIDLNSGEEGTPSSISTRIHFCEDAAYTHQSIIYLPTYTYSFHISAPVSSTSFLNLSALPQLTSSTPSNILLSPGGPPFQPSNLFLIIKGAATEKDISHSSPYLHWGNQLYLLDFELLHRFSAPYLHHRKHLLLHEKRLPLQPFLDREQLTRTKRYLSSLWPHPPPSCPYRNSAATAQARKYLPEFHHCPVQPV
ncbi:hypothetical protein BKA61DRAFT_308780 [Leptodontidium sp. MPI-SDFR-AT-0119]|nr:hypothetical protein BKA61DRAFT_308780 [Leptodontidium sp. MPI-SDFR-AT-0119]